MGYIRYLRLREVITVHTGQAGVQLGSCLWELTCVEHGLDPSGCLVRKPMAGDSEEDLGAFFERLPSGNVSPRAVLIDTEPTVIDEVRTGSYGKLFMPKTVLSGKEDAANNFARGYRGCAGEMMPRIWEAVRGLAEACDRLQGFMMYHSYGGGTGSGLHAALAEQLSDQFPKRCKIEVAVFPSPTMSTSIVEPYNCVFCTDATLNEVDCVCLADNEALYKICLERLDLDDPSYSCLNRLLAQTVSSITASLRYPGSLNADFTDFQTNLVPYPRIHYPVISYAPIVGKSAISKESLTVMDMSNRCFERRNMMVKCNSTDGQYIACVLLYRGNIVPKDVNEAIHVIKSKREIRFVPWCPTGFKVGINDSSPGYLEAGELAKVDKAVCLISNSTSIRDAWARINSHYQMMYTKRAFLHWFETEGLTKQEMLAAHENVLALQQDYDSLLDGPEG